VEETDAGTLARHTYRRADPDFVFWDDSVGLLVAMAVLLENGPDPFDLC